MIINVSRGPVIDQKALAWALDEGEILYAGLDTADRTRTPIDPQVLPAADPVVQSSFPVSALSSSRHGV